MLWIWFRDISRNPSVVARNNVDFLCRSMWAHTIQGIYWFVTTFGFIDLDFDVAQFGIEGWGGTGTLGEP